jgi:hypothetical protein
MDKDGKVYHKKTTIDISFSNVLWLFCFCDAGYQTQGLMNASDAGSVIWSSCLDKVND